MKIKLQWLMAILLCICCGCGKTQDREAVLKKELDKHIDSQFSSAVVVAEKAFIITKESDDVVMYVSKLLYQEEMDECFTAWYGNDNSITVGMESEDAYGRMRHKEEGMMLKHYQTMTI